MSDEGDEGDDDRPFDPDWCSAPGDTLRDILEHKRLSPDNLAALTQLDRTTVDGLLAGDVELTWDIARRLEMALGASAQFWINREADYRDGLRRGLQRI